MSDFVSILGGCHCGNVRFTLFWPRSDNPIAIRQCGCSFCRKHGGAWTSNRDASLTIQVADEEHTSKYRFGTATSDFFICMHCGIVPFVVSEIDGRSYAVVNTNSFELSDDFSFSSSATNFDGEGKDDRLARRKRNWINQVVFSSVT